MNSILQTKNPVVFRLTFFQVSFMLSVPALLASVVGVLLSGSPQGLFPWLIFYLPLLWALWLLFFFFALEKNKLLKLFLLWIVIDAAALGTFICLSFGLPSWSRASGADIVPLISYFPAVAPIFVLIRLVAPDFFTILSASSAEIIRYSGGETGGAVDTWFVYSMMAAIQSFILIVLGRLTSWFRQKKVASN